MNAHELLARVMAEVEEVRLELLDVPARRRQAEEVARRGRLGAPALGAYPGEDATVARMVELRGAGLTLEEVGARLLEEGHRPRTADRWHPKVVAAVVARQT